MKKILISLAVTLLSLTAVGCAKDEATSTETPSIQTEAPQKDELQLEKTERFYVNAEYFKELSVNKSTAKSQDIGVLAQTLYDIETRNYIITLGDLHQGGANYVYSETIYDENEKKYDIIYKSGGKEVILTYCEEDDTYHIFGNLPSAMTLDSEMIPFDYYIEFYEKVTDTVIGNSPNIKKEENKIYIHVDDTTYQLLISPDSTIDSQESSKMQEEGALGYVYLVDETDKDSVHFLVHGPSYYYFIEGKNFIIKNADGEIFTTLELN